MDIGAPPEGWTYWDVGGQVNDGAAVVTLYDSAPANQGQYAALDCFLNRLQLTAYSRSGLGAGWSFIPLDVRWDSAGNATLEMRNNAVDPAKRGVVALDVGSGGRVLSGLTRLTSESVQAGQLQLIGAKLLWGQLNLPWANGWSNFGGRWRTIDASKDQWGVVRLRGLIANANAAATGNITTLPAGWIPADSEMFSCVAGPGGARVDVERDGTVNIVNYFGGGNANYLSLHGISFQSDI